MARRARASVAALLALCALAAACEREPDHDDGLAAAPALDPDVFVPAFDGERAYGYMREQVAFGPRVPGSEGHAAQLGWMEDFLRERADTVILQIFEHRARGGEALQLTNVLARFRPAERDRVLLVAHWDTRPMAERDPDPQRRDEPILGANDGASGVAVLMELANGFSEHSPPLGVDLLFVDGEDYGPGDMMIGSRYFAANLPPGYRPLYGIVVDMVADRSPQFPVEEYSWEYAPEVVDRVWRMAERLGYGAMFPRQVKYRIEDDHIPLNQAGIRTIDIIDFDYGPGNRYWHTTDDVLENTSPRGPAAVGTVLANLIYRGG